MRIDLSHAGVTAHARQISTASLGDHSYVVVVGSEAVAIDIQRDLDRFDGVLAGVDARLTGVFETHIHNDYVSGGSRLAQRHGALYYLPANSGAPYEHEPLADGASVPVGGWSVRAMHTPGHTFNHMSYVLESPDGPVAIFSGGSMLVGAVGRSDLLGPDHTDELLAHQYASVHRIADELPDPSVVAPTHGSGSFCSASDVSDSTSTIERERLRNPALLAPSVDAFAMAQVMGYRPFPAYYRHMAPANLVPLGEPSSDPLPLVADLDEVEGATLIDVRAFDEYAAGHLPGSLSFPRSNDDAVYMGWTLDWGWPVVLVGSDDDTAAVRTHLHRIGWDAVVGRVDPGDMSRLSDGTLLTTRIGRFEDLVHESGTIIDVRDPIEQQGGIVDGAVAMHIAEFADDPRSVADDEVVIYCQSGYRAGVAAGFAEAVGLSVTVLHDDFTNYRGELSWG